MKGFKNPKAIQLILEAQQLEDYANKQLENQEYMLDSIGKIFTEAAGLRALADDIEYGVDNGLNLDDGDER